MNITIKQLQILVEVADTQSYTRAAERLHMTQPAVSMQMKQLEEIVGLSLFERQGKKIVLSELGESMRVHAAKVLKRYQRMQQSLKAMQNIEQQIKVSAATTANHFITHMMSDFSQSHPEYNITLDITNRESLVSQLQGYDPDFVIMGEPPSTLDIHSKQIMENPLVVIASVKHSLAKRETIDKIQQIPLSEIVKESFVVREEGSGTKAAIRRHFKNFGFDFVSSYEMSSNESIKHAVVAGLGLGIVALHTIKLELEANQLVVLNVEEFPIERYWNLVSRKGKNLSDAALAFQDFIMEKAPEYQESYKAITRFIKTEQKMV